MFRLRVLLLFTILEKKSVVAGFVLTMTLEFFGINWNQCTVNGYQ